MQMGLNLKDEETVALVSALAKRTGQTKTATVRELARARLAELDDRDADAKEARFAELMHSLETEVWPHTTGLPPITKKDIEDITGMTEMFEQ